MAGGLYEVLATLWALATNAAPVVAALVAVGWLVAAVYEGRDRTPGAGFLVRPDRDDVDSWVDERMISQALAHLGIAPLGKFFKDAGNWSTPCPPGWTEMAPTPRFAYPSG